MILIPILRFRISCSVPVPLPVNQFLRFTASSSILPRTPTGRFFVMSHSYTTKAPGNGGEPAKIRPSASVCLLNSKNQVLLVQRTASASSFANTHVFPGGNMDAQDNDSYALCAIRELFEEAGVLLTTTPPTCSSAELDDARKGIHSGKLNFTNWLSSQGLTADTSSLKKFTTWITPPTMKKRYNTQMYLAFLNNGGSSQGLKKEEELPKHDGGVEIISTSYRTPVSALWDLHAGRIILFPPQAYLLTRLSEYIPQVSTDALSSGEIEEQRKKIVEWLEGEEGVGEYVFTPKAEGRTNDGRVVLGYGPKGDRDRRTLLKVGKDGMPRDVHVVMKEEAKELMKEDSKL